MTLDTRFEELSNYLTFVAMAIVVALSFVIQLALPDTLWYVYLAIPVVAGIGLIPLSATLAKKRGGSHHGRKDSAVFQRTSYIVFRLIYPIAMTAGLTIIMSGVEDRFVLGIGFALLATGIALGLSFGAIYTIIAARN